MYRALSDRRAQAREREDWLVGRVLATIANWSSFAPKTPLEPKDFGLGPSAVQLNSETSHLQEQADMSFTAALFKARAVVAARMSDPDAE